MSSFHKEVERDYGVRFPAEIPEVFLMLTLWKKHREFFERDGVKFKDPWEFFLRAARVLFTKDQYTISPWSEEHARDFTEFDKVITIGCASSSKSNDYALLILLDWLVDPSLTVSIIGSTTKQDLQSRSWASLANYFQALKNNKHGFLIPGKMSKVGFRIVNSEEDDVSGTADERAGIQGRSIDEGRLQGAHAPYVRMLMDELAEMKAHDPIKTAIANLSIGAKSFKFMALANPGDWDGEASRIYCMPEGGPSSVTADSGTWRSTFGALVRHHDGLKSPTVLNPELKKEYPYLISQEQIDSITQMEGGNFDSPRVWKMVRGFPMSNSNAFPTLLEPGYLNSSHCMEPVPPPMSGQPVHFHAAVAGCDPAYSADSGDKAIFQKAEVLSLDGFPIIDFSGGTTRLIISASSELTTTQQIRDQLLHALRLPKAPDIEMVAVDASGNQGIADNLDIYVGRGCLHVNNSQRASDVPLRAGSASTAKDQIYDRGTESWAVLAEFVKSSMVRGLPEEAAQALVSRRLCLRPKTNTVITPYRLESKEDFRKRFKGSPDVADACALAALVVKERLGILPFSTYFPKKLLPGSGGPTEAHFEAVEQMLEETLQISQIDAGYRGDSYDNMDSYSSDLSF